MNEQVRELAQQGNPAAVLFVWQYERADTEAGKQAVIDQWAALMRDCSAVVVRFVHAVQPVLDRMAKAATN